MLEYNEEACTRQEIVNLCEITPATFNNVCNFLFYHKLH